MLHFYLKLIRFGITKTNFLSIMKNIFVALALFFALGASAQIKKTTVKETPVKEVTAIEAAQKDLDALNAFISIKESSKANLVKLFETKHREIKTVATLSEERKSTFGVDEGVLDEYTIRDWVNIQEVKGFNYTDFLIKILSAIEKDDFKELKAITEDDEVKGLLSESEIEKLRKILKQGFKNNETIKEIETNIKSGVNLKDRITENGTVIGASSRATNIARTETVRLANEGLKDLYKENKILQVRWLSVLSNRTCPECVELNGRVFEINNLTVGVNQPPLHNMCRCSLLSIKE